MIYKKGYIYEFNNVLRIKIVHTYYIEVQVLKNNNNKTKIYFILKHDYNNKPTIPTYIRVLC